MININDIRKNKVLNNTEHYQDALSVYSQYLQLNGFSKQDIMLHCESIIDDSLELLSKIEIEYKDIYLKMIKDASPKPKIIEEELCFSENLHIDLNSKPDDRYYILFQKVDKNINSADDVFTSSVMHKNIDDVKMALAQNNFKKDKWDDREHYFNGRWIAKIKKISIN